LQYFHSLHMQWFSNATFSMHLSITISTSPTCACSYDPSSAWKFCWLLYLFSHQMCSGNCITATPRMRKEKIWYAQQFFSKSSRYVHAHYNILLLQCSGAHNIRISVLSGTHSLYFVQLYIEQSVCQHILICIMQVVQLLKLIFFCYWSAIRNRTRRVNMFFQRLKKFEDWHLDVIV